MKWQFWKQDMPKGAPKIVGELTNDGSPLLPWGYEVYYEVNGERKLLETKHHIEYAFTAKRRLRHAVRRMSKAGRTYTYSKRTPLSF